MRFIFALLIPSVVNGCDKEHHYRHHDRHIRQRDTTPVFPPILTPHEQLLVSSFDNTSIASWSSYYSHKRNLAGESDAVPKWTVGKWAEYGFDTRLDSYRTKTDVYLDYPVHQSLSLKYPNGSTYNVSLEEDVLDQDDTSGALDRVPAFHGYSGSGNATAEYVYVGQASAQDFHRLRAQRIPLSHKIALAKHGGPFRGTKVRNAQAVGMRGILLFTDPRDDKEMAAANLKAYPEGPARNPSSIQRGSVVDLSLYPGDPTTPGYASREGVRRVEMESVPRIPSLPVSWAQARVLLGALEGCGGDTETVGRSEGVGYSTGPCGAVISMENEMRGEINWIHNAIGIVNGTEGDEVVVVGNHHDAWVIGGAADPHSGSAILIELAKAMGRLLETGWRPKRTIVLCSWDAEEYGLVGSTEWVEEYIPWLKSSAVSYLNIDVGVAGTIPDVSASPDLHSLITSTMQKVIWPHCANCTMYDVWEEKAGEIDLLGAQSDYTAFVHRGGISAMDIGTTRAPLDPIYHTHSNFDSYHWMTKFADAGFAMHKAVGQFLTLLLFQLVNEDVVPLDPAKYSLEMRAWLGDLQELLSSANATTAVRVEQLEDAIAAFEEVARLFNAAREMAVVSNDMHLLKECNRKARDFGRGFISQGGLSGRGFYQHLLFAPGLDTGYKPVTFPGVTETVAAGNLSLAKGFMERTAKAVLAAASILGA